MPGSMPLPANGGQNTSSKRRRTPKKPPKWTLLRLLETWFLTDDGKAVIVDPTAGEGADHDEWRHLVRRTGVRIPTDELNAPWFQMARRDFLNWCEENLPEEKRPRLFASKQEALDWWNEQKISKDFESSEESSKSLEISERGESASEGSAS